MKKYSNSLTERFDYNSLINKLKTKKFTKIAFLTGANISVAGGIPSPEKSLP